MPSPAYGSLLRIDAANGSAPEILRRVPLQADASTAGVSEQELQNLLFRYPQSLPIADIDAAYADAVPICQELRLPAGYADALYINHFGKITLAEFKLWRNPQARREVIGQILDYAKDLASWNYDDLQRQVSLAAGQMGNSPYALVRAQHPQLGEADFVDNVTRHLQRGEFLLLIIGDGIREDAAQIVDFVQHYSGLHFNLALVEAALYRDSANALIVQPRILARTEIVQRIVVDAGPGSLIPADIISDADADADEPLTDRQQQCLRFWNAVLHDYSFADTTVRIPADLWPIPPKDHTLSVMVQDSGFGGWALTFNGYLRRSRSESRSGIGCYLTPRKDHEREVRIFNDLAASLDELCQQLPGLEYWDDIRSGRPRIGFRRQGNLAFLADSAESDDFRENVQWMREHLNLLVSTLHPRLQTMLKAER